MIKYHSVVLICKDLQISGEFYQGLFGLEIELAIDGLTTYKDGISLWKESVASDLMYSGLGSSLPQERPDTEIYFETDDLDGFFEQIRNTHVKFLHQIETTPWQQRTVRFFDPDDHLIEVGESMEEVIRRIAREGHTPDEVAALTMMPKEIIKAILDQKNTP